MLWFTFDFHNAIYVILVTMQDTGTSKKEYRRIIRDFRCAQPPEKLATVSRSIQKAAIMLIRQLNPEIVHCYLSTEAANEVCTDEIIDSLLTDKRELVVPRILSNKVEFENVLIHSDTDYSVNKWGIREPVNGTVIPDIDIELVLVPLLCADLEGRRIGYGKGYYDRFLHSTAAVAVGLCPEDCLFESVPFEDHDKPLDYIITEKRILRITI
jgi:5-formyltetrahydrofolate cyclo-ligase